MAARSIIVCLLVFCGVLQRGSGYADIYRWDTGKPIAGTQDLRAEPGMQADRRRLHLADLAGRDLTNATFESSTLTRARLTGASLVSANFVDAHMHEAQLENADLTGAILTDAYLSSTTSRGFTKEQLYSTASYQSANLRGLGLVLNDLTGWSFSGMDLTGASFHGSTLEGVSLEDAVITGADFDYTTHNDFSKEQLYSTSSYRAKDLRGLKLWANNLIGWDFSGQNLTGADLESARLTDTDFVGAWVAHANLRRTVLEHSGFTKEQLYSTASYQEHDLQGINLSKNDLSGWDFSGQDLAGASLHDTIARGTDFSGANLANVSVGRFVGGADLRGANLANASMWAFDLESAQYDSHTTYNQWTWFQSGFDPVERGLTFVPSLAGDFNLNNHFDIADLNMLIATIREYDERDTFRSIRDGKFDVNSDAAVDRKDLQLWVKDVKKTWFGDANLDGVFDSADLALTFQAGQYEDIRARNSTWASGDWNADGDFTTSDLVIAFRDGGYERGPREPIAAVPEPSGAFLIVLAVIGLSVVPRTRRRSC